MPDRSPIIDVHTHAFPPRIIDRREDLVEREPAFGAIYGNAGAKMATADELLSSMDEAGVDALVFLTLTCPATPLPGVVDPGFQCRGAAPMPYTYGTAFGGEAILMASLTGLPEITVPAGHTRDGVPIAVSFFGRAFDEATLIRLAYAYEQATRLRRPAALRP